MTDDSSTPTSMADARVNQLLCGTEGDAGENYWLIYLLTNLQSSSSCVYVEAMRGYCQREVEPMGKESEEVMKVLNI